jgi:hypothetical protein
MRFAHSRLEAAASDPRPVFLLLFVASVCRVIYAGCARSEQVLGWTVIERAKGGEL